MPYITREDGEHFVIPSYRDVLSAKSKSQFKKDVLLLSQSYGDYITLQKKNAMQYEIAFSPDLGYLLGETVWQHFKKPEDMVYCEAIPGSEEVILVIVKDNSVYLDGSFPTENVSEELVVFLTQQAHFEIYTYGDVPIADSPEDGKFSFDVKSVKSFTRLDNAVFPTLPLISAYKLALVDTALKAQGIGALPIKQIVIVAVLGIGGYLLYSQMTEQPAAVAVKPVVQQNPYKSFYEKLQTPAPDEQIVKFLDEMLVLMTIPGFQITSVDYDGSGQLTAKLVSVEGAGKLQSLLSWAKDHNATASFNKGDVSISTTVTVPGRAIPDQIYNLQLIMANFVDKLQAVYPGNNLKLGDVKKSGVNSEQLFTLSITDFSPAILELIGSQFNGMPFELNGMKFTINQGSFTGTITIDALGS